jgi:ribosomal protein L24E
VESCALCGRTILLGERILRLRIDGRRVALCPLCEESMRAQRFERAA